MLALFLPAGRAEVLSFAQGLPAPIVGAMAENASLFWTYTELQRAIRRATAHPSYEELSLGQLALAGAGAGSITSFVLYAFPPHASTTD